MRKVNLILSTIAMTAIMFTSCGNESSKNNYPSKEVTIGKQVWMTENLNVNKFRNGDLIPEAKTDEEWKKAGEEGRPAWCYYDNKSKNGDRYGKLYNWYAVNDPRGLAPVGWKIPTDEDWSRLTDYLEHPCVSIGTVLKFTDFWDKNEDGESGNGINACGFAALPGGSRYTTGMFGQIGRITAWWSSTESGITNDMGSCAWIRLLSSDVSRYNWQGKGGGLSVRCIRD